MEKYLQEFLEGMKGKSLEEFKKDPPEVIIILDGDLVKRELFKKLKQPVEYKWVPPDLTEGDAYGVTGAKIRFIAGAECYKELGVKLATTSAGHGDKDKPVPAEHTKKYLQGLGVLKHDILTECESVNTAENIIGFVKLAYENDFTKIAILSNAYHLPRIKLFCESLANKKLYKARLENYIKNKIEKIIDPNSRFNVAQFFKTIRNLNIDFISAENILLKRDKRYKPLIDEFEKSHGYQKRIYGEDKGELKGYAQLMTGTYGMSEEEIIRKFT